jgi:hypothetical protein
MKIQIKGQTFEDTVEIQAKYQVVMDSTTKQEFQKCFQKWER